MKPYIPFLLLTLVCYVAMIPQGYSQTTVNPAKLVFADADTLNIVLMQRGVKVADKQVVAWFPKDSLSQSHMQRIVDTLNLGIKAVEAFIGAPLPWQVNGTNAIYTFYFRPDRFIAHASMLGYISVPFWRVKNGTMPWLHETVHEMLNSKAGTWANPGMSKEEAGKRVPLWLGEGLTEYITREVSRRNGFPKYDVHSSSFATNIDSLFKQDLKKEKGAQVLPYIGTNGVMPELFSNDRSLYSPAFYHGSCSLVGYIARQYGIKPLLTAISSFNNEAATLEKLTGKSMTEIKQSWLQDLERGY